MKIDVEDSEFELIKGAKKILKKNPIILFEVSNFKKNDRFFQLLKKTYNYKFLYVLKKRDFSSSNFLFSIIKKIIISLKYNSTDNKFYVGEVSSVSKRSGNSHFAIISKDKLI